MRKTKTDSTPGEEPEELSSSDLVELESGSPTAEQSSKQKAQRSQGGQTTTAGASKRVPGPPPPPAVSGAAVQVATGSRRPKGPPAAPPRLSAKAAAVAVAAAAQPRPKKRGGKAWFEEVFDEDYLRTLPFLTPQATQREALFIVDSLGVKPGAHLLDVGCGYGRHAMELVGRGYHVVGLDLALPLLIRGADEAQRRGLTINFVHGDMRELTFDAQFDGAYCVFSTFGYFDDDSNRRVLRNIARALKPGARFLLDVLNRDYVIAELPTRVWWEGDGCVVLEEVDFNYFGSRLLSNRSVVFEDGRQLEQEISIRAYSVHELVRVLVQTGFKVAEISGNLATRGRFFGNEARQILIVAERVPEESNSDGGSSKPKPSS
ncbi:MAG: class I SAM-dependent methyltransferase [Pseudomonadota bacterium]